MAGEPLAARTLVGVVDDHPIYRLGLETVLNSRPDSAAAWTAGNVADALRLVAESPPDVVLMDLDLGEGGDSITAIRDITHRHPRVKVVVITALADPETAAVATRAGAAAVLTKDLPAEALVRRLREIVSSGVERRRRGGGDRSQVLTVRERQVLLEIGAGRTNREIARRLGVSTSTVNKHVQHVLHKLNVRNRAQAVAMFGRRGQVGGSGTSA